MRSFLYLLTATLCAGAACAPNPAAPRPPSASASSDDGGRLEAGPKALDDVGIEEHLGASIPLNLQFVESVDDPAAPAVAGQPATMGRPLFLHEVFNGVRPVLLTLNYSDCPMLCGLQLDGLVDALHDVGLVAGKDFDIVTVSINPNEKPERTANARRKFRQALVDGASVAHRPEGWRFLTGEAPAVQALAQAVGFSYAYVAEQKEFAHGALITVVSPEARITRYLYGVTFVPRDVRLALVESAEGKVGSTLDRILLYCFHYDATTGRYAPLALNIMRLGGAVTAGVLSLLLGLAWRRDRRRARRKGEGQ